jgi:hypothetical protein
MSEPTDNRYSVAIQLFAMAAQAIEKPNAETLKAELQRLAADIEADNISQPGSSEQEKLHRQQALQALQDCLQHLDQRLALPA